MYACPPKPDRSWLNRSHSEVGHLTNKNKVAPKQQTKLCFHKKSQRKNPRSKLPRKLPQPSNCFQQRGNNQPSIRTQQSAFVPRQHFCESLAVQSVDRQDETQMFDRQDETLGNLRRPAPQPLRAAPCWGSLPNKVMHLVLNRSFSLDDLCPASNVCSNWGAAVRTHPVWRGLDLYDLVLGCALLRRGVPVRTVLAAVRAANPAKLRDSRMKTWHVQLGDTELRILGVKHSAVTTCTNGDTGLRLWPLALRMSQFLSEEKRNLISGQRCLELGAGVGALTVACASMQPAIMHSTEMSRRCRKLIAINCANNQCDRSLIHISKLQFGSKKGAQWLEESAQNQFDTIVGCEIVYEMETISPLFACIRQLLSTTGHFVLGYYERASKMTAELLQAASVTGLEWEMHQLNDTRERVTSMLGANAHEAWRSDFLDSWRADRFFVYTFRWIARPRDAVPSEKPALKTRNAVQRLQEIILQHNHWSAQVSQPQHSSEYICSL